MAIVAVMLFSLGMTAWSKRRQARVEAEETAAIEALREESSGEPASHRP
jgi:hypothetical protein